MTDIWQDLPRPFFVLAPMDDVTDTVFRRVVAQVAKPDLFFTEFVSVDGLQSVGRDKSLKRIRFEPNETPIIAQIWGKNPENYYKTAQELVELGFSGIDINMGCPDKTITKNGCCAALIQNRDLALEIIDATREGAGDKLPISVKTRLGFNEVDYTWHELLLKQKLNALTIHGRTKKQMSDVPADWDKIQDIRQLRDSISPDTVLIGNGDVMSRRQGAELAAKHGIDGIMIGRGIFQDLYAFAEHSDWPAYTRQQRLDLYRAHVELFADTWQNNERKIHTLNKFCKVYIQGFDGAKELREKLMAAQSIEQLVRILTAVN